MITTKKGKEGKTQVTWRSTVGWSSRALKEYNMVGQKDYVQLTYEGLRNGFAFTNICKTLSTYTVLLLSSIKK